MATPKPVSQLNHASHRACFAATASTPLSNLWNSKTFADLTFCCWKLERRHMERTLPKIWICLSFFHKSIVAVHIVDPFMIQYCNYMCFENTYIQTNHLLHFVHQESRFLNLVPRFFCSNAEDLWSEDLRSSTGGLYSATGVPYWRDLDLPSSFETYASTLLEKGNQRRQPK